MSDLPRVLFVEDELLEARAFVRCLRGFAEPSLAFTARQAKDMLRDGAFAAWIIDIHLPDGNGIDLLTFGRTLYASTPAVLVSGAVQVGHWANNTWNLTWELNVPPGDWFYQIWDKSFSYMASAIGGGQWGRRGSPWVPEFS